ncbi:fimbrin [Paecilomyces lecythidis]|uniref:Fimbrin n=1 Tax=Paecilomyces lecythidis TaxID=3004212 RepID=A0ABR3WM22_9EURO
MSSHLSRKRATDTFLQFLINSSSMIIVFLSELCTALATGLSISSTPEEAISSYLQQNPDSSLANVLAAEQQQKKLNMVADDILASFLDATAYRCEPVKNFLREIFAGLVLEAVIKSCSSPHFINGWIVYLLEEGEPELMNAIDAGVEGARKDGNVTTSPTPVDESVRATAPEGRLRSESLPPSSFSLETDKGDNAAPQTTNGRAYKSKSMAIEGIAESTKKDLLNNGRDTHYTNNNEPISRNSADGGPTERGAGDSKENTIPIEGQNNSSELASNKQAFTDFDQILPPKLPVSPHQPAAPQAEQNPPLTLHCASVSIDDLSESGEKGVMRAKPTGDYALQIEPASSRYPGWIVFRKYSDFESLHEVLGPISRLNHLNDFAEHHPTLPAWKGSSKQTFRQGLEQYLRDALRHETLAESERMRRFLGKDRNLDSAPKTPLKSGFSFPGQTAFEGVGKGVLDALTNAPKGVAGGSKAVFGGMTGVFGGTGGNKRSSSLSIGRQSPPASLNSEAVARSTDGDVDKNLKNDRHLSTPNLPSRSNGDTGSRTSVDSKRSSLKSPLLSSPECSSDPDTLLGSDGKHDDASHDTVCVSDRSESGKEAQATSLSRSPTETPQSEAHNSSDSVSTQPKNPSSAAAGPSLSQGAIKGDRAQATASSLSSEEAQMAVELIFAVINELYTLSSAWNFRKTLLNAAKSYILRPGNPNLEAIRALLQESVIETYTKDDILADQIKKLRENCLPTEDELKAWPPPPDDNEQEKLRNKARRLLVERGMPQALVSVMGAAATGEALGKVFDCLQIEVVARGFVFAVLLQALKTATL